MFDILQSHSATVEEFSSSIVTIKIVMKPVAVCKSIPWANNYFISMHSPNHLPDFAKTFKQIDIFEETTIKYSENRIQRLGKGFDTDCYDYESDNKFGYYRMRSDCINHCYQNKMREI